MLSFLCPVPAFSVQTFSRFLSSELVRRLFVEEEGEAKVKGNIYGRTPFWLEYRISTIRSFLLVCLVILFSNQFHLLQWRLHT